MVEGSLQSVMSQLTATQAELQELSKLSGKNRELAKTMLARLEKDRAVYLQHMESFKNSYGIVLKQGHALMANLDEEHIDELFTKSARDIEGSWTTAGLWRSMNSLFESFTRQADKILSFASETRNFVDKVYQEFQEKYGFVNLTPPPLNLEKHILTMKGLKSNTERFCRDPMNVMTEKHFLVKRFYNGLVTEARIVFQAVRKDLDGWLKSAHDAHLQSAQGAPDAARAAGGEPQEAVRRPVQPAGAPASARDAEDGAGQAGRGSAAHQVQGARHRRAPESCSRESGLTAEYCGEPRRLTAGEGALGGCQIDVDSAGCAEPRLLARAVQVGATGSTPRSGRRLA